MFQFKECTGHLFSWESFPLVLGVALQCLMVFPTKHAAQAILKGCLEVMSVSVSPSCQ